MDAIRDARFMREGIIRDSSPVVIEFRIVPE